MSIGSAGPERARHRSAGGCLGADFSRGRLGVIVRKFMFHPQPGELIVADRAWVTAE